MIFDYVCQIGALCYIYHISFVLGPVTTGSVHRKLFPPLVPHNILYSAKFTSPTTSTGPHTYLLARDLGI